MAAVGQQFLSAVTKVLHSGILSALTAGMYVIAVNNDTYQHDKIIMHISTYEELAVRNHSIYADSKQIQIQLFNE